MTTTKINLDYRGYQPLSTNAQGGDRLEVEEALASMGFLDITGDNIVPCWVTQSHVALIVGDSETLGVEVKENRGNQYGWLKAAGKYDSLSLAEKHALVRMPGESLDQWLAQFDACGKPRPGDGVA